MKAQCRELKISDGILSFNGRLNALAAVHEISEARVVVRPAFWGLRNEASRRGNQNILSPAVSIDFLAKLALAINDLFRPKTPSKSF